ncbi:MAG: hypothetical protein SWJ54_23765 [Cyanobacteriota bacterium]|nr:hypothetical protein [Cyanobacteriota bacterium]
MNLFSNQNSDSENGHRSGNSLNALNNHHSDPNSIEDVEFREPNPETIRILQKSFIFLIIVGLLVGVIVAAGVIYILNRFDITGQPPQIPIEQIE